MNDVLQILETTVLGSIASFCLGLIWGSFFNVCILRLPEDEPMVFERSRCPQCKSPIPWYLNLPILSYLWLRGKCRNCHNSISLQYPLIELASGCMFLALQNHYGWSVSFVGYTVFCSLLLVISVIDLHHQIIPDELSLSGAVLGFIASFFLGDVTWVESLLGILLGGGIFLAIAWAYEKASGREGLGGGDVKLLGMIGAWLGYQSLLLVIVVSSAVGSVVGLTLMAVQRKDFKSAIPFGPFLALAAVIYLFCSDFLEALLYPTR